MSEANLNRLSFNEAVVFVKNHKRAAFAAMPVFGDDEDDETEREVEDDAVAND